MLAVDTNVLVRLLTNDDSKQHLTVVRLLSKEPVWISKTVLLETEWVLRSGYGFSPDRIQEALTRLLGLPNVDVEDASIVAQALLWVPQGLDFADALHLAAAQRQGAFATFDQKLAKHCHRLGLDARLLT